MVKRKRVPSAEENHFRAKMRRLAYGEVASVTCVRELFEMRSPPSIKEERKVANKENRPKYNFRRLMELGKKGRDLFQDD